MVDNVVQGLGWGVLKLVTAGYYRNGDNGLLLEGRVGLFLLGALFFLLQKLVL